MGLPLFLAAHTHRLSVEIHLYCHVMAQIAIHRLRRREGLHAKDALFRKVGTTKWTHAFCRSAMRPPDFQDVRNPPSARKRLNRSSCRDPRILNKAGPFSTVSHGCDYLLLLHKENSRVDTCSSEAVRLPQNLLLGGGWSPFSKPPSPGGGSKGRLSLFHHWFLTSHSRTALPRVGAINYLPHPPCQT